MTRVLFVLSTLFALSASSISAQASTPQRVEVHSWVTELAAGAGLDIGVRGPWIAPDWRESAPRRVLLSVSMSLIYEFAVEPWNGHHNGAQWRDVGQRLAGTVGTEVFLGLLKLVFD